jgi:hypothetical protein
MPQKDIRQYEDGSWGLVEGNPVTYTIMAVVKMREEGVADCDQSAWVQEDLVRMYAPNLAQIVPIYEDSSLMSREWSVEDIRQYPMEYMLFYIPYREERWPTPWTPEIAPPPRFDVDAYEALNALLDSDPEKDAEEEAHAQAQAIKQEERDAVEVERQRRDAEMIEHERRNAAIAARIKEEEREEAIGQAPQFPGERPEPQYHHRKRVAAQPCQEELFNAAQQAMQKKRRTNRN